MVRHITFDGFGFAVRKIDSLVKSVIAVYAEFFQFFEIFQRSGSVKRQSEERRIGGHDFARISGGVNGARLNTERLILIIKQFVESVILTFGNAPHAAELCFFLQFNATGKRRIVECKRISRQKNRRQKIFEHRTRP